MTNQTPAGVIVVVEIVVIMEIDGQEENIICLLCHVKAKALGAICNLSSFMMLTKLEEIN